MGAEQGGNRKIAAGVDKKAELTYFGHRSMRKKEERLEKENKQGNMRVAEQGADRK